MNKEIETETEIPKKKKSFIRDIIETILVAGGLALIIRALLIQPFYVPSSSMMPNIHGGVSVNGVKTNDHLFALKFIYGWRIPKSVHVKNIKPYFDFYKKRLLNFKMPQRGDIIIFEYPNDPSVDFVKRVVGVSGDVVELKNNIVYINGKPLKRKYLGTYSYSDAEDPLDISFCNMYEETNGKHTYKIIQEIINGKEKRSFFGPVTVPEGKYFAMGDNRDNSQDSRIWGFVPQERIKGTPLFNYWPVSRWGLIR